MFRVIFIHFIENIIRKTKYILLQYFDKSIKSEHASWGGGVVVVSWSNTTKQQILIYINYKKILNNRF